MKTHNRKSRLSTIKKILNTTFLDYRRKSACSSHGFILKKEGYKEITTADESTSNA